MATEIIDLTDSPPSSPPSPPQCSHRSSKTIKILELKDSASSKKTLVKIKNPSLPLRNHNPIQGNIHLQWSPGDLSRQSYGFRPIIGNLQPTMQAVQTQAQAQAPAQPHIVAAFEPEPNGFLFPQGMKLEEPWTPKEHEQFLMGLGNYGRGCWTKIARHFVCSKTPQQVQSYATNFFRHMPATCHYNFITSDDLMPASTSTTVTILEDDIGAPPTLTLFPVDGEKDSYNNNDSPRAFEQLDMKTTSTDVVAVEDEVDLELRLGRS